MKKGLLKKLTLRLGLLVVTSTYAGDPFAEHITVPDSSLPSLLLDHTRKEEAQHAAETLRLEHMQEKEEQSPVYQTTITNPLASPSSHHPAIDPALLKVTPATDTLSLDTLTTKELAALKVGEHHTFAHESPSSLSDHSTNLQPQLNFIRHKITNHLTAELMAVKEQLTTDQIKNREMVIKFFEKAGTLTPENLETFRPLYKKLAEWDGKSTLGPIPKLGKSI
jgi:hypothetical protein